jgi:hypothetical protein
VLQELRETVAAATDLVAEIGLRFKAGDPADELVSRLQTVLAGLFRQVAGHTGELPDDIQTEIAELLDRVQTAVADGDEWLARAGPELASQYQRERLLRAYGAPDGDRPHP